MMPRWIVALGAALSLLGCGNAPEESRNTVGTMIDSGRSLVAQRRAPAPALQPTAGFPGVDPALIVGVTAPLSGGWLPSRQALATMTPTHAQGERTLWATADGVTFTLFGGGLVVSTRGLGTDLHASEVGDLHRLIAAGQAGQAARLQLHLDGAYAERPLRLTCTVQPEGPETLQINGRSLRTLRIIETCSGAGDQAITNRYWRDENGPIIRQSVQWLGPDLGSLYLQRLIE